MGLDMYLKAKKYVNKHDYKQQDSKPKMTQEYINLATLYPELDTGDIYGFEISRSIAYWRKANQVHVWFVLHCQGGEDDCREHYVDREQLQELLDLCKKVLDKKDKAYALEHLPPQQGFFFGSTEIDDWYWQDITETIVQLSAILENERLKDYDFYYQASW